MEQIKNKEQLALFIQNFFDNENNVLYIKEKLENKTNKQRVFARFFGNLLNFVVATRSTLIADEVFDKLFESKDYTPFLAGKEIVSALTEQFKKENITPTTQNILSRFKHNFVDNGFYMHAFNNAFEKHIKTNGANAKVALEFDESKSRLSTYIDYPYAAKSYRFFVSGKYEILLNYGIQSPEWFYNLVRDPDVFYHKDQNRAYNKIMDNVKNSHLKTDDETFKVLSEDAKKLTKILLDKKNRISVAVIDKKLKTEDGSRVFPDYLENDSFEERHFEEAELNKFAEKNALQKDKVETIGSYFEYLISQYALYETSTYHQINQKDLARFTLPDLQKFALKENVNTQSLNQIALEF